MILIVRMFKGKATPEAAGLFLRGHGIDPAQLREFCGVPVSVLGMGTYLGNADEATDTRVAAACVEASEFGCNLFDTAINYRAQRAERSVGEAIRRGVLAGKFTRNQIFISTKGGFLPGDGSPQADGVRFFRDTYVAKGLAFEHDLVAGCHCIEPGFIDDQIERSRRNLGVETIDLYYLHNPETQLEEFPERVFYDKLERVFRTLERAVRDGRIGAYGLATWGGLREDSTVTTHLSIERAVEAAKAAAKAEGAAAHHLKAVQLPLNLAMPEAALLKTQRIGSSSGMAPIDAAQALGLSVAVSVPLFQSRLCHGLPDFILNRFPNEMSQAHCALAFATAFASVDAALVGMKRREHVTHNLEFLKRSPLDDDELRSVLGAMLG